MFHPKVLFEKGPWCWAHVPSLWLVFKTEPFDCRNGFKQAPNTQQQARWHGTNHNLLLKSQLGDWSEEGFRVSSLLSWGRLCVSWHRCRVGKAWKILTRTWGKQPHFSQKKRWIHRVDLATAEGTCVMGTAEAKCVMGKILTDSAQDANMQMETKLNAIEQDNTYPSNEENSQHTRKKDGV